MAGIFSTEFLQTLTSDESKTLTDFYAAATKVQRPKVRKTCREAGFIREPEELTKDGIFLERYFWRSRNGFTGQLVTTRLQLV